MSRPNLDPTAGERARAIAAQPGDFHPIIDPTDPRYREGSGGSTRSTTGAKPIFDPANPDYGRQAD